MRPSARSLIVIAGVLLLGVVGACAAPGASSAPQPIAGAVLGGTADAFTARYGAPTAQTDSFTSTYAASVQGTPITLFIGLAPTKSADGKLHVATLGVAPPQGASAPWDAVRAMAAYTPFLPPDAVHQSDTQATSGTAHIYLSKSLANTFPASLFVDTNGKPVSPGTFFVECMPTLSGPSGFLGCEMQLGEVFT